MKYIFRLLTGSFVCLSLSSCFKEEPLNAECDITSVSFHVDDPLATFFNTSDTLIPVASDLNTIQVTVRRNHKIHLIDLEPRFTLTPGATITLLDAKVDKESSMRLYYVVNSEDRQWSRRYVINISSEVRMVNDTIKYDFEHFELEPKGHRYYIWHNVLHDGTLGNDWANGNPGFRLSMGRAAPDAYPSAPIDKGYDRHALQLTTRSTGPFGVLANKRIAAGSFFLGTFDMGSAVKDPMRATRFGVPLDREPVEFTGFYKYAPGSTYQDRNGKAVPGQTDEAAIYAVLYRNHDDQGKAVTLYGDDVKTSKQIVAIADMGMVTPTDKWTAFKLLFNYTTPIDYELLANRGYSLAIVFSSSREGDKFEGAIGSQLCIDKVRIISKKEDGSR